MKKRNSIILKVMDEVVDRCSSDEGLETNEISREFVESVVDSFKAEMVDEVINRFKNYGWIIEGETK